MRLLAFLAALGLSVQAAPPPSTKPAPARTIRVPLSTILPEARTGRGVPPLKPADLNARVSAGKARIVRVRTPQDDLLLLIVLDLAGDLALVEPARSALIGHFDKIGRNTRIAIMRSQDELQVLSDPTSDTVALQKSVLDMPITGKAGLLDTIETAVRLADGISSKTGVRVAVLYVTDSDVKNYREDFTNPVINSSDSRDLSRRFPEGLIREKISKVKDTLLAHQTPVFIVHLKHSSERLNVAYQSGLVDLANATGGSAVICRSSAEIGEAIARTMTAIDEQYLVTVQLPPKVPKTVTLTLGSERPLSYRSFFILR